MTVNNQRPFSLLCFVKLVPPVILQSERKTWVAKEYYDLSILCLKCLLCLVIVVLPRQKMVRRAKSRWGGRGEQGRKEKRGEKALSQNLNFPIPSAPGSM